MNIYLLKGRREDVNRVKFYWGLSAFAPSCESSFELSRFITRIL